MNEHYLLEGEILSKANVERAYSYAKDIFVPDSFVKFGGATLTGFLAHFTQLFNELFLIIVVLMLSDFALGFGRAVRDSEMTPKWSEAMNSTIKLLTLAIGVVAIHSVEHLIISLDVFDLQRALDGVLLGAFLGIVGVAESISIVKHLIWHFPPFKVFGNRLISLLQSEPNAD